MRGVVRAYQESAALIIHRYAGHIAQYLGGGLLVYFGYPTVQGDDAQRAVHSALGIVEGLIVLNAKLQSDYGIQLAVRIGVQSSPAVPSGLPLSEAVPLLASLLSLSLPSEKYPSLQLNPQQHKQQLSDLLIAMTLAAAERQPLLAVWEDLHWADPSTLDLLTRLLDQVPTASLLMTLTSRPEFVSPWAARTHITPLTLNRLERPQAIALIGRTVGEKPLPDEVIEHIANKADGVPLYVEELTKTILASQIVRDTGAQLELTGPNWGLFSDASLPMN